VVVVTHRQYLHAKCVNKIYKKIYKKKYLGLEHISSPYPSVKMSYDRKCGVTEFYGV
jgi:predicted nucleic-acid-binding Zn-ribbon protein